MRTVARTVVLLASLLTSWAGAAAPPPFTLEQVLSAPYPTSLVAAAAAERIAWTENAEGRRSLWTAAAPGFEPVRLTEPSADDGQVLADLALTADGSILVWVRGGGPNPAGEIPNPTSDPDGATRAIWAVATSGPGRPWKVADGPGGFELLPDGSGLIYAAGGKAWRATLEPPSDPPGEPANGGPGDGESGDGESGDGEPANGDAPQEAAEPAAEETPEAREPQLLFGARGALGQFAVSPDGSRIAFSSDRGDHSFVGVVDLEARRVTWIAPGVDRDGFPVWSPDGERLAYLRLPGARAGELPSIEEAPPFSLRVADPGTGVARTVWESPAGAGGYAQSVPAEPLLWAADDTLVFLSEHAAGEEDRWLHLHAVSAEGGEARDLTPGPAEVQWAVPAADRRAVIFSSNHDDPDRRHLWQVAVDGSPPRRLTGGSGIETDPVALPAGRLVAFRGATYRTPPAIELLDLETRGRSWMGPEPPAGIPAEALVEPEPVVLTAGDGLEVHGQLFLPPGPAPEGGRPAAIFLHGGPWRQMLLGWHYRGYYGNAYAFNQYLASRGTVVLALNFRSGIGYGRAFRRAEGQGPRGATEYQDLLAAGLWLRSRSDVDGDRIGLWGGSYGGYMTALGLARDSDLFAAGVDLHGVHDWAWRGEHFWFPGGWWGLQGDELLERARLSSPVADLTYWTSPVLFVHGDDDRNVDFLQTTDLVQRLRERGVPHEVLVFPDEVHGFLRHESWLRTYGAAAEWFGRWGVVQVEGSR